MEMNEFTRRGRLSLTIAGILAITAWLGTQSQSNAAGIWTNEPSDMAVVLDCPFSGTLCPGMFNVYQNLPFANLSLSGGPTASPTGVLDYHLNVGDTEGGGQFGYDFRSNLGRTVREVYLATWWATNADSSWNGNNVNKMIFISGDGNNNFLGWNGDPTGPKSFWYGFQSVNCNSHIGGACGDGTNFASWNAPANVSSAQVNQGTGWHLIEIYQRASTSATSRDGILRIWLDGVMTHNYPTLNLSEKGFHSIQYNSTWGGFVCGSSSMYVWRDCTKERHHYYDHLRVSVGGGTSSSSVDQPPGPPAAPTIRTVTVQ